MRRFVALFAMLGFLATTVPAMADHRNGYCPMMIQKHSKELKLSKKQMSEIKKIQDQMMDEMRAMRMKYSDQVGSVLTQKQKDKYSTMKHDCHCPMCESGECKMMKDGECPMMKDKKGGECGMHEGKGDQDECPGMKK